MSIIDSVRTAINAAVDETLTGLRDRLIRDQAALIEAKAAAHRGNNTTAETLLDGQLAGLAVALRYIAEETAR